MRVGGMTLIGDNMFNSGPPGPVPGLPSGHVAVLLRQKPNSPSACNTRPRTASDFMGNDR